MNPARYTVTRYQKGECAHRQFDTWKDAKSEFLASCSVYWSSTTVLRRCSPNSNRVVCEVYTSGRPFIFQFVNGHTGEWFGSGIVNPYGGD